MYKYNAVINKIIDGDTVNLTIDLGFRLSYTANCRLAGINAPEMSTEAGKSSKIALTLLLGLGNKYLIESTGLDKYGRPIVEIWKRSKDGIASMNQVMIEQGHAVKY